MYVNVSQILQYNLADEVTSFLLIAEHLPTVPEKNQNNLWNCYTFVEWLDTVAEYKIILNQYWNATYVSCIAMENMSTPAACPREWCLAARSLLKQPHRGHWITLLRDYFPPWRSKSTCWECFSLHNLLVWWEELYSPDWRHSSRRGCICSWWKSRVVGFMPALRAVAEAMA